MESQEDYSIQTRLNYKSDDGYAENQSMFTKILYFVYITFWSILHFCI